MNENDGGDDDDAVDETIKVPERRKFSYKVPFAGILMVRFMEGLST